jgi:hypothetical protein
MNKKRTRPRPEPGFRIGQVNNIVFVSHSASDGKNALHAKIAATASKHATGEFVMLFDPQKRASAWFNPSSLGQVRVNDPDGIDVVAFRLKSVQRAVEKLVPRNVKLKRGAASYDLEEVSLSDLKHMQTTPQGRWVYEQLFRPWGELPREPTARGTAKPQPAAARMVNTSDPVQRAIEIRNKLRQNVPMLDAQKWSAWRGSPGTNPSAALGKYKKAGRVFAVSEGRTDFYPEFQFAHDGTPLDAMTRVLAHVDEGARGWPLLSWFESPSHFLDGKKPSEMLLTAPERVAAAAKAFYSDDD